VSKTQKKITLLWGLPGSGKTTYAGEACPPRTRESYVVDVDSMMRHYKGSKLVDAVGSEVLQRCHYFNHIIVDGLITLNAQATDVMMGIQTHPYNKYELIFEIVWWGEDRESCKWNDRGRRKLDSAITIDNAPFEVPSQELALAFNIPESRIVRKKVERKPAWKVWAQEHGFGKEEKMKGSGWSLGGTSGSCWSDEKSHVSAEPQPASFKEFDELLTEICPNISFLAYKKLYNETVTTETSGEGDYYGGYVEHACYVCDVKKLYDMLVEMNVVTPPEPA